MATTNTTKEYDDNHNYDKDDDDNDTERNKDYEVFWPTQRLQPRYQPTKWPRPPELSRLPAALPRGKEPPTGEDARTHASTG